MTLTFAPDAAAQLDARLAAPGLSSWRRALRAPVDPATWRAIAAIPISFVWCLFWGFVAICTVILFGAAYVLAVGPLLLTLTLLGAESISRRERYRLRLQLGADIPAPTYRAHGLARHWWFGNGAVVKDGRRWANVSYFMICIPLTVAQFAALGVLIGGVFGGLAVPFLRSNGGSLPGGSWTWTTARQAASADSAVVFLMVVGAIALIWIAPLVLQYLTYLQVRLARSLLGPSKAEVATEELKQEAVQLTERVDTLETTRSDAVDAADAERRRIERDLHDGAQQRLVALGMELGIARRTADADPDAAKEALDRAHGEVKEVLAELRDLVRGIHPAVLTDRGLDAALAGLASRSPIPVEVNVTDADAVAHLPQATQAAAYFVAAECLTNVARHSGATQAWVEATPDSGHIRLSVRDNGHGGARLEPGGGLDGLRARVAALDGSFVLDSPDGAGTTVAVVI